VHDSDLFLSYPMRSVSSGSYTKPSTQRRRARPFLVISRIQRSSRPSRVFSCTGEIRETLRVGRSAVGQSQPENQPRNTTGLRRCKASSTYLDLSPPSRYAEWIFDMHTLHYCCSVTKERQESKRKREMSKSGLLEWR